MGGYLLFSIALENIDFYSAAKHFVGFFSPLACGILVPQPGIEPMPPAVEAWSPNHWPIREFPEHFVLYSLFTFLSSFFHEYRKEKLVSSTVGAPCSLIPMS